MCPPAGSPGPAAKSVLVVDDSHDACQLLARLLVRHGCAVTCACGGAQALSYLATTVPSLVILDLMMPDVDGMQVLRSIRHDPRTADVPVVLFSAVAEPAVRAIALASGATEYWLKAGVDYGQIRNRVLALLGL